MARETPGPVARLLSCLVALILLGTACDASTTHTRPRSSSGPASSPTTSVPASMPASSTSAPEPNAKPCQGIAPPPRYEHVVVIMMENRTWAAVGGPGFAAMPYLASLARSCAFYTDWTETNRAQDSLTQYIGLTSGVDNPDTVNDCAPGGRCISTDDNIFRQVRRSGGTARSYVEDAPGPCSAGGDAAKHVPALYYRGTYSDALGTHDDFDFCTTEVRPAGELHPDHLPTFAFITPNPCNDGHDCGNVTVDAWARAHLGAIFAGADFRSGTTAVFVLWDESYPVPNLLIAPGATPGPIAGAASHADALKTMEELLGLSSLDQGQLTGARSLRPAAHL